MDDFTSRARTEILEELGVQRGGGFGILGVTSFAGPIVANQAAAKALSATVLPNGEQVLTLAQMAIWQKIDGVPGTIGVPPLAADEVLATNDGTGVLARTEYSSPKWRIGVNDIFIDPANGAASDENDGFTALTPLLTGYELFRRWGWNDSKPLITCNPATSPNLFTTIHVETDLVSPDSLPIKVTTQNGTFGLRVVGGPSTILRTAVLTDAVIAMVPGAPLGGVRLTIRDNTLATWAIAEVANRRVRFTDGLAVGGTLMPQTDSLVAAGEVECSACQTTNEPGFSQVPTTVTPAVGDTYVIESLVVVNFGEIDISQELNPAFGGFQTFVNIVDCHIPSIGSQLAWSPVLSSGEFLNFYQCTFNRAGISWSGLSVYLIACYFTDGWDTLNASAVQLFGGGAKLLAGTADPAFLWTPLAGTITDDFVSEGIVIVMAGASKVTNCAVWNMVAVGGINPGGHGIMVGPKNNGERTSSSFRGTVWGNGNAGVGIRIGSACDGMGAAQNATGTAGDLALASQIGAGATCVYWDLTTSTYLPVGGQGLTWALIAAAKGIGTGYGGGAHWPDQNANWVLDEAT